MQFHEWLDAVPGRTSQTAAHFGVTVSAVTQWRDGVPPARMKAVRDLTGGEVTLEEMVPDAPLAAAKQDSARAAA